MNNTTDTIVTEGRFAEICEALAHIRDAGETLKAIGMHVDELMFANPSEDTWSRHRHVVEVLTSVSYDHYNRVLDNVQRVAELIDLGDQGLDESVQRLRSVVEEKDQ